MMCLKASSLLRPLERGTQSRQEDDPLSCHQTALQFPIGSTNYLFSCHVCGELCQLWFLFRSLPSKRYLFLPLSLSLSLSTLVFSQRSVNIHCETESVSNSLKGLFFVSCYFLYSMQHIELVNHCVRDVFYLQLCVHICMCAVEFV